MNAKAIVQLLDETYKTIQYDMSLTDKFKTRVLYHIAKYAQEILGIIHSRTIVAENYLEEKFKRVLKSILDELYNIMQDHMDIKEVEISNIEFHTTQILVLEYNINNLKNKIKTINFYLKICRLVGEYSKVGRDLKEKLQQKQEDYTNNLENCAKQLSECEAQTKSRNIRVRSASKELLIVEDFIEKLTNLSKDFEEYPSYNVLDLQRRR
jgi:hypothetical protein